MSEPRWDIPARWSWAEAGEIADIVGGGTPSTRDETNFSKNGIPWITPADLTGYRGTYINRGARDLSEKGYQSSGAQLMPSGTVLFSSRAPVGYCVIAANEISTNQGFKSLVLKGDISPEYVRHYLLASKEYAESLASGTTFKELSGSRTAELSVPVAPLAEQRRIVAKLDTLTGATARARAELDRIPALIARYKQAILSAAFTGELTADWRAQLPDVETASSFARRMSFSVGEPEKLYQIPMHWQWMCFGDLLTEGPTNGYSPKSGPDAEGTFSLKLTATTKGELDLSEYATKRLYETVDTASKYWLIPGDLLIQRANSIEYVGASAIYDGPNNAYIYPDLMMRVRIEHPAIRTWIWRYLNCGIGRTYLQRHATGTAGTMPKINSTTLRELPIPLPPEHEITEGLRRIETAFGWLDRLVAEHGKAMRLLPRLDQEILAKAFRGELVPQDPSDEPASALLERIRAERATKSVTRRGRRTHTEAAG